MSGGWTANARWDIPSDNQYYVDLTDSEYLRSARQAQATGFAGLSRGSWSEELSATWYKELGNPPNQDNTVQRLPEYTATLLPIAIPIVAVDAGGEFQATNFYRRNGDMEVRGNAIAKLSRSIDLYPSNERFVAVTVAALDEKGCAKRRQEIHLRFREEERKEDVDLPPAAA